MSWILHDPDEWETVSESHSHGPGLGSFSVGQRRRHPADVARIKAARREREEAAILRQADAIRARRAQELLSA